MAEKAFALRIKPELKAAAKSLMGVHNLDLSSINEALAYLIRKGAEHALVLMEQEVDDIQMRADIWKEIAKFLIDNPTASHALAENFPDGSLTRQWIKDGDEDNPNIDPGWPRADAFRELAVAQKELTIRSEARAALLKAAA